MFIYYTHIIESTYLIRYILHTYYRVYIFNPPPTLLCSTLHDPPIADVYFRLGGGGEVITQTSKYYIYYIYSKTSLTDHLHRSTALFRSQMIANTNNITYIYANIYQHPPNANPRSP